MCFQVVFFFKAKYLTNSNTKPKCTHVSLPPSIIFEAQSNFHVSFFLVETKMFFFRKQNGTWYCLYPRARAKASRLPNNIFAVVKLQQCKLA